MNAASSARLINVAAASQYLGISTSTLNKWRVYGNGPLFIKVGKRVVYDVGDLDAWIAAKRRASTSAAA